MKLSTIGLISTVTGAAAFIGAFIGGKKAADDAQDEVIDCLESVMDDYLEAIGYYDEAKSDQPQKSVGKNRFTGAVTVTLNNGRELILPVYEEQLDYIRQTVSAMEAGSRCEGCGK